MAPWPVAGGSAPSESVLWLPCMWGVECGCGSVKGVVCVKDTCVTRVCV